MRKTKLMTAVFAAAALGIGVGQASATTFFADGFNYPDGNLVGNATGWQDHSGGFPFLGVSAGEATIVVGGSEDAHRTTGTINDGLTTWYYAMKITPADLDPVNPGFDQEYFGHFMQHGTFNFRGRAYMANASLDPTGLSYAIGLSASSGGLVSKTADILFSAGEQTIVVSFDPVTGTSNLWLNPTLESDPFITDTNAGAIGNTMDSLALRQGSFFVGGSPALSHSVNVNGVAIADNFQGALAGAMVVPEPASLALIGMGGLMMLRRR